MATWSAEVYFCRMKQTLFLFCLTVQFSGIISGQSTALFDDSRVSEIFISIPQDSLAYMISNQINNRYLKADFIFDDGIYTETFPEAGIRLRGNTSLSAQKKSFKISFNTFDPDLKYQEVRKINLRGSHNDPTMVREKLFFKVWEKANMPMRRTNFIKFYINGTYYGLYTNVEEVDKIWLKRVFENNDGNLYKCTWPADLAYINDNQQSYKTIMNNPESRAYDLVTNESDDDYSRLVLLIKTLNLPVDAAYPSKISAMLNVESVLKSFAIDIATGNWDDYFYNKNNYYLYDNPLTGKFEYFTFDTDNTFGVDWVNRDWATRNCLSWQKGNEPRPLATKLLAVPAYKDQFIRYLDTITRQITYPDSIFPYINYLHNQITVPAIEDIFRTYDYGYTINDFHNGFTQTVDGHTPYGIKPFLETRYTNTLEQIEGLIGTEALDETPVLLGVYPNPGTDGWYLHTGLQWSGNTVTAKVYDLPGRLCYTETWVNTGNDHFLAPGNLHSGAYILEIISGGMREKRKVFLGQGQ